MNGNNRTSMNQNLKDYCALSEPYKKRRQKIPTQLRKAEI